MTFGEKASHFSYYASYAARAWLKNSILTVVRVRRFFDDATTDGAAGWETDQLLLARGTNGGAFGFCHNYEAAACFNGGYWRLFVVNKSSVFKVQPEERMNRQGASDC